MNAFKTILPGLLLVTASATLGFAAHTRSHAARWSVRSVPAAAADPAIAAQIARAQAAAAFPSKPDPVRLFLLGF